MFCSMPFTHCYLTENGDLHLCCPGWMEGTAGNILQEDPMAVWRGSRATEMRESIVNQSFRLCSRCRFKPDSEGECLKSGPPRPISLDRIDILTLNHDATCNLACPSCRKKPRGNLEHSRKVHAALLASDLLVHTKHLAASGDGDPIASPLIWPLLCQLGKEQTPELTLSLQTNGLLFTRKRWKELGSLRDVLTKVSVSIDAACENTYKLNRGGNWTQLTDNLGWMSSCDIPLQLNFVIQANNFREIPSFVDLGSRANARKILFSSLDNWDTYSSEEYLKRAVHLPGHPLHENLIRILDDMSSLKDPRIATVGISQAP